MHADFFSFDDECPSQATIKFWITQFKREGQIVVDREREGHPKTLNNEENFASLLRLVVHELTEYVYLKFWKGSFGVMLHEGCFEDCSPFCEHRNVHPLS